MSSLHEGTVSRHRSVSASPQKPADNYERLFPPFFIQSHTALASWNRFGRDDDSLQFARSKIDSCLDSSGTVEKAEELPSLHSRDLAGLLHVAPGQKSSRPKRRRKAAKDLVTEIHGTSHRPIDLTVSRATQTPLDRFKALPIKSLKFFEDVRPPYIGTRTQLPEGITAAQMGRNPFKRSNPSLEYDYDSEAEWEPLGEGEDLNSEGEDDDEEDGEDDLKDFVVDEGEVEVRKQPFIVAKEQTTTGICWEDAGGRSKTAISDDAPSIDMQQYKLEMIAGRHAAIASLIITNDSPRSTRASDRSSLHCILGLQYQIEAVDLFMLPGYESSTHAPQRHQPHQLEPPQPTALERHQGTGSMRCFLYFQTIQARYIFLYFFLPLYISFSHHLWL